MAIPGRLNFALDYLKGSWKEMWLEVPQGFKANRNMAGIFSTSQGQAEAPTVQIGPPVSSPLPGSDAQGLRASTPPHTAGPILKHTSASVDSGSHFSQQMSHHLVFIKFHK